MTYPKVSIIILNWNQLAFLQQCLKSIIENTNYPNSEIIILDNGSKEKGTAEYLKSLPFQVILSAKNLGYARGNNQAAKKTEGDFLLFLNNDVIAEENWLAPMVELMLKRADCGLVGSKLLYPDRTIQHIGVAFDWRGNRRHIYKKYPENIPPAQEIRECEAVTGACLLIRRKLFEQVGGFDERYKNGSEDIDLCLKVRAKGYRVLFCPQSTLIHFEKTSLKNRGSFYKKFSTKCNNYLFQKKWGKQIDLFRLLREAKELKPCNLYAPTDSDLVKLIPQEARFILDVGCASGLLGKKLKEETEDKIIWGIKIDSEIFKNAEKNLGSCSIGEAGEVVSKNLNLPKFDCLIFAGILEHLQEPWKVLKKFRDYLHPQGRIICSVSNIRHYKVIKDLLRDRWFYREDGILEEDHLRFFSLSNIKRILTICGYQIESLERKKEASSFMKVINYLLWGILDDFLTQRYLIVAKKRDELRFF